MKYKYGTRGFWDYYNSKYLSKNDFTIYPEFFEDLKNVLGTLMKHKLLIPKEIDVLNQPLKYRDLDELMLFIKKNIAGRFFEFTLYGDTIIYTNKGEELFSYEIYLTVYALKQSIYISANSDIWLPMRIDEDFSFHWNLNNYRRNYHRLEETFVELAKILKWDDNPDDTFDNHEYGSFQYGYKIFLTEDLITFEYLDNPNPDFDLEKYLLELNNAKNLASMYNKRNSI